ncbi:MAG: PQQ-binding-like beta-propeller repeat protein, partial [Solirubrobacteraceae bacterium]
SAAPAARSAAPAARRPRRIALAAASPWPEMRHDPRNTGFSPIVGRYHGDRPWAFATGRGIFATPVIGGDGTIYVGSGDGDLYAIGRGGRLRWRLRTGGLIDAAGALSAYSPRLRSDPLTFGSADDHLYHVTTPRRGRPRILWRFRASVAPVSGQRVDWWEGNIAVGPGGDLYAGNTGGTAYAIDPDGAPRWTYTAGNSVWTTPAFAADGSTFWGSLDLSVFRLSAAGRRVWRTVVPGYVVSSPAIGSDGTVYVGSFDSRLYALDPRTGAIRWSFATSDHIYASPALGSDRAGRTDAVYIASADGSVYALTPGGRLRWSYVTGEPVRSSPVVGLAPGPGRHEIVYVGSSDGRLYALDAATGRRRWSYDTTPANPLLSVRNNLNASPALGRTGVYIAGEDGSVYYVPYDYCRHRHDPRCSTAPGPELGENLDRVYPVDVGGNTIPRGAVTLDPATVINLRLIVRRHGRTVNAAMLAPDRLVRARPAFAFTTQESGDGHYLSVVPDGLLAPGTDYRLRIAGAYTNNGTQMGNFDPHGRPAGRFDQTITIRARGGSGTLPLTVAANAVSAITISRLSVPLPAFLASVNQIGFDSYDWIASTIARTRHTVLLWVTGARRTAGGRDVVDPRSPFGFPLAGRYRGSSVILSSPSVSLTFSFGAVPLRRFTLRGSLAPDLSFAPGASLYAETVCATVPHYGPELAFTGICNPGGVLAASGTFITGAYRGAARRRPSGVRAGRVQLREPTATAAGSADVRLAGARLPAARRHVVTILLAGGADPVALDYRRDSTEVTDRAGAITGVRLTIPRGTALPPNLRAYVIVDAFPIADERL